MSSVQIYNNSTLIFPEIKKAGKNNLGGVLSSAEGSTDTTYMLPVIVNSDGYIYNGLNIIEVLEDGFFVVDKNMNAIFSSRNIVSNGSSSSSSSSTVDPNLANTVSALLSTVEGLSSAINSINTDLASIKSTISGLLENSYVINIE